MASPLHTPKRPRGLETERNLKIDRKLSALGNSKLYSTLQNSETSRLFGLRLARSAERSALVSPVPHWAKFTLGAKNESISRDSLVKRNYSHDCRHEHPELVPESLY